MRILTALIVILLPLCANANLPDTVDKTIVSVVEIISYPALPLKIDSTGIPVKTKPSIGTGFFISEDEIVTSYHIIDDSKYVKIQRHDSPKMELAMVVGYDIISDIALLRVIGDHPTYLTFTKKEPRVGQDIFIIGTPFGEGFSVSKGIVSANRRMPNASFVKIVQTDASVNFGNSGGPLLDMDGKVIGVVHAIITKGGGFDGIGLSIDTATVVDTIARIRKHGIVHRPSIGLVLSDNEFGFVEIVGLVEGGAGQVHGLQKDDVIVAINKVFIRYPEQINEIIQSNYYPGDTLEVEVLRKGKAIVVFVVLDKII